MESTDILLSPVHGGNIVPSFAPIVAEIVDRSRRAAESNLPLFIIVQYDYESDKISFQEKLKKALVQEELRVREFDPVHNEAHGTGKLYPLLAKASAENAVCLVFGLPRTDGEIRADHEFVHYLNIYRDRIVHERIRMILMLPSRDAEQFIFSAGDLWDFRHATYWLERPAIKSSDFQWSRMETQTSELPLPEPDMAEIQSHIRNTRPLIDETRDPSEKAKLYLQLCRWLERRNAVGPALDAALEGLQEPSDKVSETWADLEYETGNLLEKRDQFAEAARHLKTCLMLHETSLLGKTKSKAKCLEKLGDVQHLMSDLSGAKSSYGAALPIYREIGARLGEANCLTSLGDLQMRMDDLSGAKSSYGAALPVYREIGARLGEANCLRSLGDLQMRMDDLSGAKSSYGVALPIYREIGDRLGEANCLRSLGSLQMRMSDLSGAKSSYGAALPIYREIGYRLGEANCLTSLGDLQMRMSDLSGAKSSYGAALPIYREIGARLGEANCRKSLGDLQMRMDDLSGAKSSYGAALPIYREIGARLGEANCRKSLGDLQMRMSDLSGAKSSYGAALPIYREIGNRLGEANCLQSEGLLMLAEGEAIPGFQRFLETLVLNDEIGNELGRQAAFLYLARSAQAFSADDQALLLAEESIEIGRRIADRFTQTLNFYLQIQIWDASKKKKSTLAAKMILRDLYSEIQDSRAKSYAEEIEESREELGSIFQEVEKDPESIRAAAIAEARERFAQTGRDLLDPPPETK